MNIKHLGYLGCCSEVFGSFDITNDEYKEDWKYMKKESKKHAMEKYTLSKMKMIKVYIGLPDPEDDSDQGEEENSENSQEEKSEGERSEGKKSEGESSESETDACTCFLRIINDF